MSKLGETSDAVELPTVSVTVEFEAKKVPTTECNLCLESMYLTDHFLVHNKERFGFACNQCSKPLCYVCLMKTRDGSCPFCRHSSSDDVHLSKDWRDFRQEEWNERQKRDDELDLWEARFQRFRANCQRLLNNRSKINNRLTLQKRLLEERVERLTSQYDCLLKRHNRCSKKR